MPVKEDNLEVPCHFSLCITEMADNIWPSITVHITINSLM